MEADNLTMGQRVDMEIKRLRKISKQCQREKSELEAENARLKGDTTEWYCEKCNHVFPWEKGDKLLKYCKNCNNVLIPSSVNIREIARLREQYEQADEAIRTIGHGGGCMWQVKGKKCTCGYDDYFKDKEQIQERNNSARTSARSCSSTSENNVGIEPDRVFRAQGTKSGKA